ncbi:uncharacterized protein LOC106137325 [Amyelois transitella]|uniref:uncharacterized protein LOC106137325 n=1 Tax=Amyelois transitella TaxID=680683 RepID=UPI00067AB5B3|nr:uncharacterized protein LOC106137325 [Amyelois transitella]
MSHLLSDVNPFSRTGSAVFSTIVEDAMKRCNAIVIFVEDQFCSEDVSGKDHHGTPFVHIQEDLRHFKAKYIPNVVNPLNVLIRSMKLTETNMIALKPGQNFQPPVTETVFYVFFEDNTSENRIQTLRRHDALIREIYTATHKMSGGKVVGFYTGKVNPVLLSQYGREVSYVEPILDSDQTVFLESEGALFRFVGITIETPGRTRRQTEYTEAPVVVSELRTRTIAGSEFLRTNIEFHGLQIKFSFSFSDNYWSLDNITLVDGGEEMGSTVLGIRVPIENSYYCDEPLRVINENDRSYVNIPQYQIQPFRSAVDRGYVPLQEVPPPPPVQNPDGPPIIDPPSADGKNASFSDPYFDIPVKCNPYFDIPILSGLFISAICLSIMFVGIAFLFNCESYDKFDDPRVKGLEFAATE